MNLITYTKAYIFHSTNAAVKIAQKNPEKAEFARTLIAAKLARVGNAIHSFSVCKAEKYHRQLLKLNENKPEKYHFLRHQVA